MLKRSLLIAIFSVLSLVTASFAAADYTGIVSDALIYYGANLNEEIPQKILATHIAALTKTAEFGKLIDLMNKQTGLSLPPDITKYLSMINELGFALTPNSKDFNKNPNLYFVIRFKTPENLNQLVTAIKDFTNTKSGGAIEFTEKDIKGIKVTAVIPKKTGSELDSAFKEVEHYFFSDGPSLYMFFIQKDSRDDGFKMMENAIAALKDPKLQIGSNPKFASFLKKVNNSGTVFYIDGDIIPLSQKAKGEKAVDIVESIGFSTAFKDMDVSSTDLVVTFKPTARENPQFALTSKILGSASHQGHSSEIFPPDSILQLALKFTLGPEVTSTPAFKQAIEQSKMMGLDLNEVLSWLGNELAIGVNDYNIPSEEKVTSMDIKAPEIFIALHTKDVAKAYTFVKDKLAPMIAQMNPMISFAEDATTGALVSPVAGVPMKDLAITIGKVGNYLLIASTKDAFIRCAKLGGKGLNTDKDFISCMPKVSNCFATFFWNVSKTSKIIEALAKVNPSFQKTQLGWQKGIGLTATFDNTELRVNMTMIMDWPRLIEEFKKSVNTMLEAAQKNESGASGSGKSSTEESSSAEEETPAENETGE